MLDKKHVHYCFVGYFDPNKTCSHRTLTGILSVNLCSSNILGSADHGIHVNKIAFFASMYESWKWPSEIFYANCHIQQSALPTHIMNTCTDRQCSGSVAVLHWRRGSWASMEVCNYILDLGVIWNLQEVRYPVCLKRPTSQCTVFKQTTTHHCAPILGKAWKIKLTLYSLTSKTSGIDFSGVLAPCLNNTWTSLSSYWEEDWSELGVLVTFKLACTGWGFFCISQNTAEPRTTVVIAPTRANMVLYLEGGGRECVREKEISVNLSFHRIWSSFRNSMKCTINIKWSDSKKKKIWGSYRA